MSLSDLQIAIGDEDACFNERLHHRARVFVGSSVSRATRRIGTPLSGSTRASQGMNAARNKASCSSLAAGIAGASSGFANAAIAPSRSSGDAADALVLFERKAAAGSELVIEVRNCEGEQRENVGASPRPQRAGRRVSGST